MADSTVNLAEIHEFYVGMYLLCAFLKATDFALFNISIDDTH
ncbi:hypothetical protein H1R20_g9243, partial [Candolleomyces eurysporus]